MRPSRVISAFLIASILAFSVVPASAVINLLQNPGFETGSFTPWDWGWDATDTSVDHGGVEITGSTVHTGSEAVRMWAEASGDGHEALAWIEQDIDPKCAKSLEFWYIYTVWERFENDFPPNDNLMLVVWYSDGSLEEKYPTTNVKEWTKYHIDLNTTKQVVNVELCPYAKQAHVEIYVDDFVLEACAPVGGTVLSPSFLPPLMAITAVSAASVAAIVFTDKYLRLRSSSNPK